MSPVAMLFALIITASPVEPPDTLVICPRDFQPTLQRWVDYRKKQGHRILVQHPAPSSYEIRGQVKAAAKSGKLKNVLIVGDAINNARQQRNLTVPTDFVAAKVNVLFGSEPEISTDNTYADLDNDGVVDLTIGRIPVDTASQLSKFIDRVIKYESGSEAGPWQRKVNFIAGVGGFGQLVDNLIQQSAKQIITDLVPPAYDTTMTYGSWQSPYCPDPRRFSETTINRFNEGCMFWVYIGHGNRHRLDRVMLPDGRFDILDLKTADQIKASAGSPIAVFLACYTGAFDDPKDCLAETMVCQDDGPIAAVCSTRVSMPYAMSLMSLEMMDDYFHGKTETLGELVLKAKRKMVAGDKNPDQYRKLIEAMGKAFNPKPGLLLAERKEHVQLMHLLGDPLLRLQRPEQIKLKVAEQTKRGETIKVTGTSPMDATMELDLSYKRDRFRFRPKRRKEYDSTPATFASYQKTYEQTQDLLCTKQTVKVPKGPFEIELTVPKDASGDCFVRAMLMSKNKFAIGSAKVYVNDE